MKHQVMSQGDLPEAADTGAGKGTVLLVDDEPNILTALKRVLRPEKLRVLTANGGQEGLELLRSESVDVVVSDMRMPEMDGARFLEEVASRWPTTVRILLTGYADHDATVAAINKGSVFQYLSKPWEDHDILLVIRNALEKRFLEEERLRLEQLTRAQNVELKALNENLELRVKERTHELRAAMAKLEEAHVALKRNYAASVKVFSGVMEARDASLAGHSKRVAEMARSIGQVMELNEEDSQNLLFAALLHDIGKVGLPDELLAKPFSMLPAQERAQVARHTVIGEGLLMGLAPLQEAARLIRSHHERHDGKGYPDRLTGAHIPLGARILAVANDYDALQIGTLARQRMSPVEAAKFIRENRGKRYDPEVTEAFIHFLKHGVPTKKTTGARSMRASELLPGMVLARDLTMRDKLLLLSEGFHLNETLIQKIRVFERSVGEELQIFVREHTQAG